MWSAALSPLSKDSHSEGFVTEKASIRIRLEKLQEFIALLKQYRKLSWLAFKNDLTVQGAAQHYFILAIECCLDIGEIIIADCRFRHPTDNRDVFRILGEHRVLSKPFAEKFMLAAGFRNLLVHGYTKVDMEKVYQHLRKDLGQFSTFAKSVSLFTSKQ